MRYGYARVSSRTQDYSAQVDALKAAGCERIFSEKRSGKSAKDRPEFSKLMRALVPGDTVVVSKLDRLARSSRDLHNILHELQDRGCGFVSLGESWCDSTSEIGFSLVFLNNLAFAAVLAGIADVRIPWGPLIGTYVVGLALSCATAVAGLGFTAVALPTALAVAAPCVVVSASVFRRRWSTLTAQGRALTLSCLFFSAHNVDFAFLRMRESFATIGFTVALVVVFALSISAPAALLEQVAGRQARLSAQLDIARALQRRLVPDDARLEGLDFAAHMRPADSVGGDYLHLFRTPDADWFFVLDVAGHGFGAGLIALMAHSTVASIIEARPDASPRELNDFANRILCKSLEQLGERRFMTVVSVRHDRAGSRLVVSGSHEDLLIYRAGSARVDWVPVAHFPLGLGFGGVDAASIGEVAIPLAPGDLVFIGTDGLFEAPREGDHHRGQFGADRVADLLLSSDRVPLQVLKERVLAALEAFTGGSARGRRGVPDAARARGGRRVKVQLRIASSSETSSPASGSSRRCTTATTASSSPTTSTTSTPRSSRGLTGTSWRSRARTSRSCAGSTSVTPTWSGSGSCRTRRSPHSWRRRGCWRHDPAIRREVTKLVVAPPWRKHHLSPAIIAAAHSRDFMDMESERPPLLTYCCVRTIAQGVMTRHGIRARRLKPFPRYKVHELYRFRKRTRWIATS